MIDSHVMLRLVFGAAGASAYVVLALVVVRAEAARTVRAALFTASVLSAVGLMMDSPFGDALHQSRPALDRLLRIVAAGVPGSLWLAITALFRDRDVPWTHVLPAIGLMAAAALGYLGQDLELAFFFWVWAAASIALVVHAIFVVVRTRRIDLVESRRRLRRWVSAACVFGCAVLLLLLITIAADMGRIPIASWWRTTLHGLMAGTAIAVVAMFLDPRRQLLRSERRAPQDVEFDPELIRRLDTAMGVDRAWRTEGLTLAALAARLQTPEYKLRLLINGRLGHRNFTEFVNGYRVEAAKALLVDRRERLNVAQVAYEVGFSSLAPFNRAFKEITGATPTQWRRDMLIES